jgi:hypothetical protein
VVRLPEGVRDYFFSQMATLTARPAQRLIQWILIMQSIGVTEKSMQNRRKSDTVFTLKLL